MPNAQEIYLAYATAYAAAPAWFRLSQVVDGAQVITGLAAIASLFYLAKQIKVSVREQRIERSHDYLRRYNSLEFRPVITETLFFLRGTTKTEEEKIKILLDEKNGERKALASKVILCFNFFEEMGMLYNCDALDRNLIENFFGPAALELEENGMFFITAKRKQKNQSSIWSELLKMNRNLRKKIKREP